MTNLFTKEKIDEWKSEPKVKPMSPRQRIDYLLDRLLEAEPGPDKELAIERLKDYCPMR